MAQNHGPPQEDRNRLTKVRLASVGGSIQVLWPRICALWLAIGWVACQPQRPVMAENCHNALDDDEDGYIDCEDEDCRPVNACATLPQETSLSLPGWARPVSDLILASTGNATPEVWPTDCDAEAYEDKHIYSAGCTMMPDDCGDGLRCTLLLQDGVAQGTGCVRQGCAKAGEPCEVADPGRACSRGSWCADIPKVCDGCCVPLCTATGNDCQGCRLFHSLLASVPDSVELTGLCLRPI